MIKKLLESFKRIFSIVKIAKKPSYLEIKKLLEFILFLTIFIGILGFVFYVIGLLLF